MARRLLTTGSTFELKGAYSRAVVQEPFCFMSGVTGYDYSTMTISDDVQVQARQIFVTIEEVLKEAGFDLEDIVTMICILKHQPDWQPVYDVLKEKMEHVRPTLTAYVAELIEPAMKVEIQVTALRRPSLD